MFDSGQRVMVNASRKMTGVVVGHGTIHYGGASAVLLVELDEEFAAWHSNPANDNLMYCRTIVAHPDNVQAIPPTTSSKRW